MTDLPTVADKLDIVAEMDAIANFFDIPKAKAYRLVRQKLLPGVFQLGRCYFLDKSVAAEAIRQKARATPPREAA